MKRAALRLARRFAFRLARRFGQVSDERGGIMVMVVVWLSTLLLLVVFVVDVGNWFEHKRHLQMQADAAALAGGGRYRIPSCDETPIEDTTHQYAGPDALHSGPDYYNAQVGGTSRAKLHVLINSNKFWNNGGTDFSDGGTPCTTGFIDVKITEASNSAMELLSPFLSFFGNSGPWSPNVNAHARVQIKQVSTLGGSLPMAVPDVNPVDAAAIFVNEDNASNQTDPAAKLATVKLVSQGVQTLNGRSLTQWDNTASPVSVPISTAHTGVIIALSGKASWSLAGSVSTICGQTFVTCYAASSSTGPWSGLSFIHGYSTSGTGTASAPILRSVSLYGVTCTDTSAPYFIVNGNCTAGIRAKIDFGTSTPAGAPTNAVVKVPGYGCPNSGNPKGCPLQYDAGSGTWSTTTPLLTFPSAGGALPIDLNWGTSSGNGSFSGVQRAFSASAASGPVEFARLAESGGLVDSTSLSYGSHPLIVSIGIRGSLGVAQTVSDPTVLIRVADSSGSNNQALDCDAGVTFRNEIKNGCQTDYHLNTGQNCPNSAQPPTCVPTATGDKTGQLSQGMNDRFVPSGVCVANNWVAPAPDQLPAIDPNDPRAIPLIVTAYGAFDNNGSGYVPVLNFAAFYVTGWDGADPACSGINQPFPGTGSSKGDIWGHFITYSSTFGGGTTGTGGCSSSSIGICTPVLTE